MESPATNDASPRPELDFELDFGDAETSHNVGMNLTTDDALFNQSMRAVAQDIVQRTVGMAVEFHVDVAAPGSEQTVLALVEQGEVKRIRAVLQVPAGELVSALRRAFNTTPRREWPQWAKDIDDGVCATDKVEIKITREVK